jgi:hypothetical protein
LDEESVRLLEKFEARSGTSKADVFRKALRSMEIVHEATETVSFPTIKEYIDCLAKMDSVILDVSNWESIWTEIGEGSERFWKQVWDIGKETRCEYNGKGVKDIRDILEHFEKKNWYRLNVGSENSYTLILTVSGSSRFVRTFFEGFFDGYKPKANIREGYKKLRIDIEGKSRPHSFFDSGSIASDTASIATGPK